jgi:hypothetical protein
MQMKLSDLLNSLADGTRKFEGQLDEWQKSLSAHGEEAVAKAKEWQKAAEQRGEEWTEQFKAYADGVDDDLKRQWDKMQSGFDTQMAAARKQADEWRSKAESTDAETTAKWHEAYAANMVAIAKRAEEEASKAIAGAAEARAKAKTKAKKA